MLVVGRSFGKLDTTLNFITSKIEMNRLPQHHHDYFVFWIYMDEILIKEFCVMSYNEFMIFLMIFRSEGDWYHSSSHNFQIPFYHHTKWIWLENPYFKCAWFKSYLSHWLSWLKCFMSFLSPPRKMPGYCLDSITAASFQILSSSSCFMTLYSTDAKGFITYINH